MNAPARGKLAKQAQKDGGVAAFVVSRATLRNRNQSDFLVAKPMDFAPGPGNSTNRIEGGIRLLGLGDAICPGLAWLIGRWVNISS